MSKLLLIDGMSVFMQMWHSFSCYDHNGVKSNGVGGFLNIVGDFIDAIRPNNTIIVWETGPCAYRKSIDENYKKSKFKRSERDLKLRTRQILQTIQILKSTPICQIYVDDCESVDIISYLCSIYCNDEKIIITTNKNLYQLVDTNTSCFSPIKKLYITQQSIRNEFRIFSKNFAIAKSICGDVSTNIKGVKGLGFVRISKMFPKIQSEKINLEHIFLTSKNFELVNKLYNKVCDNIMIIRNNWNLIQLENQIIDVEQTDKIDNIIKQHNGDFQHQKLLISLAQTKLPINHEKLIESMFYLSENGTIL